MFRSISSSQIPLEVDKKDRRSECSTMRCREAPSRKLLWKCDTILGKILESIPFSSHTYSNYFSSKATQKDHNFTEQLSKSAVCGENRVFEQFHSCRYYRLWHRSQSFGLFKMNNSRRLFCRFVQRAEASCFLSDLSLKATECNSATATTSLRNERI